MQMQMPLSSWQPVVTTSTPTAGNTVACQTGSVDSTLYITPAGTLATLTFNLPADAVSSLGDIVRLASTKALTALTVANAATILNAPSSMVANTSFSMIKVAADTWIKL